MSASRIPHSAFLVSQRSHRVHLHGASRRDDACQGGGDEQEYRHCSQRQRVGGTHLEQNRAESPHDDDRRGKSDGKSGDRLDQSLLEHEPHYSCRPGPERHPDADLRRAHGDQLRHHRVDPCGGEYERESTEDPQ